MLKLKISIFAIKNERLKNIGLTNKLTDSELKNACTNPSDKNYITVKSGTFELRDGNTRVFLMKERGFEDFQVPYDEINTGNFCDFY